MTQINNDILNARVRMKIKTGSIADAMKPLINLREPNRGSKSRFQKISLCRYETSLGDCDITRNKFANRFVRNSVESLPKA